TRQTAPCRSWTCSSRRAAAIVTATCKLASTRHKLAARAAYQSQGSSHSQVQQQASSYKSTNELQDEYNTMRSPQAASAEELDHTRPSPASLQKETQSRNANQEKAQWGSLNEGCSSLCNIQ